MSAPTVAPTVVRIPLDAADRIRRALGRHGQHLAASGVPVNRFDAILGRAIDLALDETLAGPEPTNRRQNPRGLAGDRPLPGSSTSVSSTAARETLGVSRQRVDEYVRRGDIERVAPGLLDAVDVAVREIAPDFGWPETGRPNATVREVYDQVRIQARAAARLLVGARCDLPAGHWLELDPTTLRDTSDLPRTVLATDVDRVAGRIVRDWSLAGSPGDPAALADLPASLQEAVRHALQVVVHYAPVVFK